MIPKGGYFGKILEVNLTNKTAKPREISDETYRKYIGGSGLGAFFLWNSLKAKANPLAPEAPIFFGVGPLNGTYCTAPRLGLVFKSPHTGIYRREPGGRKLLQRTEVGRVGRHPDHRPVPAARLSLHRER